MNRFIVGLWFVAMLLVGLTSAPAQAHTFTATHVPRAVAAAGRDLVLQVPVASGCVAYCGWIVATVHFASEGGDWGQVSEEVPHQPAAVMALTVPGEKLASCCAGIGWLDYWIEVRQQDCAGPCHLDVVRMPAGGEYRTTLVPMK